MSRFELGEIVTVRATKKDSGGVGTVNAIRKTETSKGTTLQYRIEIPENPLQRAYKQSKGACSGFRYSEARIENGG